MIKALTKEINLDNLLITYLTFSNSDFNGEEFLFQDFKLLEEPFSYGGSDLDEISFFIVNLSSV